MEIVKYNYNCYNTNYIKFRKNQEENYVFIYYSSHLFLLPAIYGLYKQNYHAWFISSTILITSLLRWKYINNTLYQYIDHNYVKIVFFLLLYTVFLNIMKNKYDIFINYLLFSLLFNIVFYYLLGVFFDLICHNFNVIFHIIMHINVVFTTLLCSYISYNLNSALEEINSYFNYYLTKFQYHFS